MVPPTHPGKRCPAAALHSPRSLHRSPRDPDNPARCPGEKVFVSARCPGASLPPHCSCGPSYAKEGRQAGGARLLWIDRSRESDEVTRRTMMMAGRGSGDGAEEIERSEGRGVV